ncbi:hypothetical protein AAFF_G00214030 [Aldrovandia affinis]|uniref:Uncharacterized protein n=1 Tax=Aldrovandia affinis TaxID=143900 RepID=A0AAD7W556_9TELE|nr:hypothetical protein AAFF_G00214030 [Aldrovandia affinis]
MLAVQTPALAAQAPWAAGTHRDVAAHLSAPASGRERQALQCQHGAERLLLHWAWKPKGVIKYPPSSSHSCPLYLLGVFASRPLCSSRMPNTPRRASYDTVRVLIHIRGRRGGGFLFIWTRVQCLTRPPVAASEAREPSAASPSRERLYLAATSYFTQRDTRHRARRAEVAAAARTEHSRASLRGECGGRSITRICATKASVNLGHT